jgi:cell wall-associated NlpC family hydrolase
MSVGYVCIPPSELRPADIIVSTGRAFISGAIRTATGADISHTILYIGEGRVIEAISAGVIERDLSEALAEANLAIALRRRNLTGDARATVLRSAKGYKGLPYDYVGAAGAGFTHKRGKLAALLSPGPSAALYLAALNNARDVNKDTRFFCSELVARCYELAALPISAEEASWVTPRSVRVSSALLYVGHLVA